ncbi:MAG TPA: hypothetical protein PLB02_11860 [Thermoanaerobaculia bacterium]|nr:hypothetical protein [Thermoanaerobaculia bacterium]HQR68081.1 hypothetical protein [Thermoanaerobaculia bacterium]
MRDRLRFRTPVGGRRLALLSLALLLVSGPAAAQIFVVGAGGTLLSDQGTQVTNHSFDRGGGLLFGEIGLGGSGFWQSTSLQARWTFFSLPGGAPDAPSLSANSYQMLVAYRFREEWWQAGFIGGGGLYHLSPKAPASGQVAADPNETVAGFLLGVEAVFQVTRQFDARLEFSGQLPLTEYNHRILALSASVAYHF